MYVFSCGFDAEDGHTSKTCPAPWRPNDKQHDHLPDYIVVDIPHLKLPSNIAPWDNLHKTVIKQKKHNAIIMFHPILT
jgi:hypothetical protein